MKNASKSLSLDVVTVRPGLSRMHVRFYGYDGAGKFAAVGDAVISAKDILAWLDLIHDYEAKALQDELPFA